MGEKKRLGTADLNDVIKSLRFRVVIERNISQFKQEFNTKLLNFKN